MWKAAVAEHNRSITVGTPSLLRSINERAVLEVVRRNGPVSRARLARDTGLSKPTVSLACASLLRSNLVREVGRSAGGQGRSAVLYEVNPAAGWVVGIDVGRRWVRAAVADITGALVARREERTQVTSARALIDQIGRIAHNLVAGSQLAWDRVTHAAIGSPGVFDRGRDRVQMAPNLPGWGRHGIIEAVADRLETNVTFENDVNLAALGEQSRGHGGGARNFVYLWVGTGIGAGIVVNGQLYRGSRGGAGEIGYLPIGPGDPHDKTTRRRGALEEAASAAGIVRTARETGMAGAITAEHVFAAARRGDPLAARVVETEARRLALAIASISAVLDPELVVLGGGVARSGDLLVEPIERELHAISPFGPRVLVSALGKDAVLYGAIAQALDEAREQLLFRSMTA